MDGDEAKMLLISGISMDLRILMSRRESWGDELKTFLRKWWNFFYGRYLEGWGGFVHLEGTSRPKSGDPLVLSDSKSRRNVPSEDISLVNEYHYGASDMVEGWRSK